MTKQEQAIQLMMEALEMHIHGAGSIIHSKLAWQAGHDALVELEPSKQFQAWAIAEHEKQMNNDEKREHIMIHQTPEAVLVQKVSV